MSENLTTTDGVVIKKKKYNIFGGHVPLTPRKARETYSPVGKSYIIQTDFSYDDDGRKLAKPGNKLDLDAMIQAALPSTDIAAIVARAKAGDESVLHVNPGFVGDSVSLPKDLYDIKRMNEVYDKAAASFKTLPQELQGLFNNDVSNYLNMVISNKAEAIIQKYNDSKKQVSSAEGDNK